MRRKMKCWTRSIFTSFPPSFSSLCIVLWLLLLFHVGTCEGKCEIDGKSLSASDVPESRIECVGSTAETRRCVYSDVFVYKGVIWIVSDDAQTVPPPVLCSAVRYPLQYAKYCQLRVLTREETLDVIYKRNETSSSSPSPSSSSSSSSVINQNMCVIKKDVGLAYGRLARANCYHSIFEDFIPIYETLTLYSGIFSEWLKLRPSLSIRVARPRHLMFFVGDSSPDYDLNYFTFNFWRRFFPQVDTADNFDPHAYNVRRLVAGSNSSCVHYFHCSRSSYSTPGAAMSFRRFLLSRVGVSVEEQARRDRFGSPVLKPLVTIIQRKEHESRRIMNLKQMVGITEEVMGVRPVVKYYSDMTLDEQILHTYQSDMLILVHGGALGNLLFARNRSTILDIYPYSFPYSYHGLVNWIRYSLPELRIGHAPFDIKDARSMYFVFNGSVTALSPCLCNTSNRFVWFKCGFGKMFYRAAGIQVDPVYFHNHLAWAYPIWRQRQVVPALLDLVDTPPKTKDAFKEYSLRQSEPWYYADLRSSARLLNVTLLSCSSHPFFRPRGRRRKGNKRSAMSKS